jgi:hypothetical protein
VSFVGVSLIGPDLVMKFSFEFVFLQSADALIFLIMFVQFALAKMISIASKTSTV